MEKPSHSKLSSIKANRKQASAVACGADRGFRAIPRVLARGSRWPHQRQC
jgi:hypothetical protein